MKDKIDYAPHYLDADKKLKEAYDLILKRKYTEAALILDEAATAVRLMRVAVKSYVAD